MAPKHPVTAADLRDLRIRPVRTRADYDACVRLQHDTWGRTFSETVPWSMLDITAKMGGVVTGAFGRDGTLCGFVYGITGLRRGELAHWSHMLAVRPEARDQGIGRRLKRAQREELLAAGVHTMYWTFDPLVARNAHLNLNVLGARVDEFVVDMYGTSDSKLHRLGTDRFIVRWDLGSPGDPPEPAGDDPIEVRIPSDIEAVEARSFDEALAWRRTTRRALVRLHGGDWEVTGFEPGADHGRYIVDRSGRAP